MSDLGFFVDDFHDVRQNRPGWVWRKCVCVCACVHVHVHVYAARVHVVGLSGPLKLFFYQRGHSARSRPPYYPPTQFRDALGESEARLVMLRCNQTVCVLKGNQSGGHISIDSLLAIHLHLNGAISRLVWIQMHSCMHIYTYVDVVLCIYVLI